ncbi:CBO0543 family protein [Bacillus sp. Marseille-P3661]|uniref:CBO0543 family protein n=1 Tax=Bacillus sp. Marseille-P3661 TaxID=1936234 RepID=UPI000C8671C5|nr:CBO0543 family protein [Bacillus sp. Marseille-P3661]
MNKSLKEQVESTYMLINEANDKMFYIWKENILFTWQWGLSIILSILPWLLWIKFRKKDSTIRLLCVGFFVLIIASWLDFLGVAFGLWYYVYDVTYLIPNYFPWDFTLIPVITMFFIQIKPNFNPFIKSVLFSVILSFLAEPFFIWLGLYQSLKWEHIYSFPIYIFIYLVADFISKRNSWAKI